MELSAIITPPPLPDNGRAHSWAEQFDRESNLAANKRYVSLIGATSCLVDVQPALVISEELCLLRMLQLRL